MPNHRYQQLRRAGGYFSSIRDYGYDAEMKLQELSHFFGKNVEIVTRPIPPSHDEGHYEGMLEKIDGDPEHVFLQLRDPDAPKPPYRRHGRGAHTTAVPINEIRDVRPV